MSRPYVAPLVWAAAFAALGIVAVAVFGATDPETPALFAGGVVVIALLAGYLASRSHGPPDAGDRTARVIPDSSVATVWLAVSLAAAAVGAVLGLWLVLIAAGMTVIGVGGLIRESRASRELAARSLAPGVRAGERTVAGEGRGPELRAPGED